LAPIVMATLSAGSSAAASPFCRPEEDPFLLLESTVRSVQEILLRRRGLPLRRTWIEQPYGEEEITLLEEEVLPVLQLCLTRVEELDQRLLAQQELLQRCRPLCSIQRSPNGWGSAARSCVWVAWLG
jgi:hypothetical protein